MKDLHYTKTNANGDLFYAWYFRFGYMVLLNSGAPFTREVDLMTFAVLHGFRRLIRHTHISVVITLPIEVPKL